ncbi:MAG: hypothetical protein D3924_19215, partial [Candidatus Electrothrix sp. AR4]|nr:hypothetical protein [Candidatus Electrothrix sp. AR4]
MYNFFSVETALENNFFDEQIHAVIDLLQREGRVEDVIYYTEDKESFKYIVTTEMMADKADNLIKIITSLRKFKLKRGEFLEYIEDTLEYCFVPEKKSSLPLRTDHDDSDSRTVYKNSLRSIAEKHLQCIQKVEKLLSAPKD